MAPTAADIPVPFDVILDGVGYRFSDALDGEVGGFSLAKATYQFSPTFVTRQNVQGDFGDNQQDFWMTMSQNDWSLGQQQRYFRTDLASKRRFWKGVNLNVREPGQVTMRPAVETLTSPASAVKAVTQTGGWVYYASDTNLYQANSNTVNNLGAHGAGAVGMFGLVGDHGYVMIAGATKVRQYSIGAGTFADFSAQLADSLAYLNNTLYGFRITAADLVSWSTAGVMASGLATFRFHEGNPMAGERTKLFPFGGKLLLLRPAGPDYSPEIWSYDGTGVSLICSLPPTFSPHDLCQVAGTLFISGLFTRRFATVTEYKPVIYYYTQAGQWNVLWQGYDWIQNIGSPGMCAFEDGLAFIDTQQNKLMFFDPTNGGIHPMGTIGGSAFTTQLAAGPDFVVMVKPSDTTVYRFPSSTTTTQSSIDLSLSDFETSLSKYFKGVKIDATIPAGASIDLRYILDDEDAASSLIQIGAVSGTEYAINVSGRALAIQVLLNKGSSTYGPTLRRVYVRAVPVQTTFKRREYVIEASGRDGEQMMQDRSGNLMNVDGMTQVGSLLATAVKQTPIVVIDRFGTYNGVLDLENSRVFELRPEEFFARIVVRETG